MLLMQAFVESRTAWKEKREAREDHVLIPNHCWKENAHLKWEHIEEGFGYLRTQRLKVGVILLDASRERERQRNKGNVRRREWGGR